MHMDRGALLRAELTRAAGVRRLVAKPVPGGQSWKGSCRVSRDPPRPCQPERRHGSHPLLLPSRPALSFGRRHRRLRVPQCCRPTRCSPDRFPKTTIAPCCFLSSSHTLGTWLTAPPRVLHARGGWPGRSRGQDDPGTRDRRLGPALSVHLPALGAGYSLGSLPHTDCSDWQCLDKTPPRVIPTAE